MTLLRRIGDICAKNICWRLHGISEIIDQIISDLSMSHLEKTEAETVMEVAKYLRTIYRSNVLHQLQYQNSTSPMLQPKN